MASNLHKLLSLLLFLSIILDFPAKTTSQQECPYPCYPPPTGPGNNPPVITTPPALTTPPASFSPPVVSNTPPAAGYFPYAQPPPYFAGTAPPPPEPILPWFPFYYRKPPHQDQSSSIGIKGWKNFAVIIFPLVLFLIFH